MARHRKFAFELTDEQIVAVLFVIAVGVVATFFPI